MRGEVLALILAGAGGPDAEPVEARQVVDMVVAQVNEAVITLSELVAKTGLLILEGQGPDAATRGGLSQDLLSSVLDLMINELLLHQEVRRLQLPPPTETEVRRVFDRALNRFVGPGQVAAFYEAYGFEDQHLVQGPPPLWSALVQRELAVASFVEARARLEPRPTADAVLDCYGDNAEFFAGQLFNDVEPAIQRRFAEQIRDRTAERLLSELRKRARLRVAGGFERSRPAPPPQYDFTCRLDPQR